MNTNMNTKIIVLVLSIISILLVESVAAGEAREVLRARLSVRRNNLKAVDAKATGVLDMNENADNADAGALLESQAKLSTLTKRFKQRIQQTPPSVESDSSPSLPVSGAILAGKASVVIKSVDSLSAPKKTATLIQTPESGTDETDGTEDTTVTSADSAPSAEAVEPSAESADPSTESAETNPSADSTGTSVPETPTAEEEAQTEASEEHVLRRLIAQASKQLHAVKSQAKKVKRENQLKYIAELVTRIDSLETLMTGRKPVHHQKSEAKQSVEKLVAEKKARDQQEIQHILAYLRPTLVKAQAQAQLHKATAKKELIAAYRHIKKVVDAVNEDIVQELAIEIAINFPLLADALGLFNDETSVLNNSSVDSNDTSINNNYTSALDASSAGFSLDNSTDVSDDGNSTLSDAEVTPVAAASPLVPTSPAASLPPSPSLVEVFKQKVQDQVKKVKSFLKGDKKASTPVKSDALASNVNKLRRQLSKSR